MYRVRTSNSCNFSCNSKMDIKLLIFKIFMQNKVQWTHLGLCYRITWCNGPQTQSRRWYGSSTLSRPWNSQVWALPLFAPLHFFLQRACITIGMLEFMWVFTTVERVNFTPNWLRTVLFVYNFWHFPGRVECTLYTPPSPLPPPQSSKLIIN